MISKSTPPGLNACSRSHRWRTWNQYPSIDLAALFASATNKAVVVHNPCFTQPSRGIPSFIVHTCPSSQLGTSAYHANSAAAIYDRHENGAQR